MSNVKSFIHGVYPRSRDLVQTSRDVDRKRQSVADLEKQQEKDFKALLSLQKDAGFDYLEDGKFTWQDIFRPITESTKGMEVGALTRWFDNNTFYRQPLLTGKLTINTKKLDGYFLNVGKQWKVSLPSPFTFAKIVENGTSSFEKTLSEITELFVTLLPYLEKKGVVFVQFNEPYIPYHQTTKAEIALLVKSLAQLKKVKGNLTLALHSYFGDGAVLATALAASQTVDVIGVDFYRTPLTSLPKKLPCDIIAGVVEGRNSLLEEEKTLKTFVEKALKYLQPETLYLSNNSDLDLLPEVVAQEKVTLLGEIRKSFH